MDDALNSAYDLSGVSRERPACRSVTRVSRVEGVYTVEAELLPVIDAIKNINMISKVRIGLIKTSNFIDLVDEVAGSSWPLGISTFPDTG